MVADNAEPGVGSAGGAEAEGSTCGKRGAVALRDDIGYIGGLRRGACSNGPTGNG